MLTRNAGLSDFLGGPACFKPGPQANGTYFRKVTRSVSEGFRLFRQCHTPLLTLRVSKVSAIGLQAQETLKDA